jgi:hypothetical protein
MGTKCLRRRVVRKIENWKSDFTVDIALLFWTLEDLKSYNSDVCDNAFFYSLFCINVSYCFSNLVCCSSIAMLAYQRNSYGKWNFKLNSIRPLCFCTIPHNFHRNIYCFFFSHFHVILQLTLFNYYTLSSLCRLLSSYEVSRSNYIFVIITVKVLSNTTQQFPDALTVHFTILQTRIYYEEMRWNSPSLYLCCTSQHHRQALFSLSLPSLACVVSSTVFHIQVNAVVKIYRCCYQVLQLIRQTRIKEIELVTGRSSIMM